MFDRRRRSRQSTSYTGVNSPRGTERQPSSGALAAASVIGKALKQNGNNPVGMKLPPHQNSRKFGGMSRTLSMNSNMSRRNSLQTISSANHKRLEVRKLSNSSSMYNLSLRDRRSISDFSEYSSQVSRSRARQIKEPTYYKKVKKWVPSKRGLVSVEVMVPVSEKQEKGSRTVTPQTDRTYSLSVGTYSRVRQANRTPTRSRPISMMSPSHVRRLEMTEFDFEPSIPESLEEVQEEDEEIKTSVQAAREYSMAKLTNSPLKRKVDNIETNTTNQNAILPNTASHPRDIEGSSETEKVTEKDESVSSDSHEQEHNSGTVRPQITEITSSNDSLAKGQELEIVNSYTTPGDENIDEHLKESVENSLVAEDGILPNGQNEQGKASESDDKVIVQKDDTDKEKSGDNESTQQTNEKEVVHRKQKTNVSTTSDRKSAKPTVNPASMAQQMRKTLGINELSSTGEDRTKLASSSIVKRHSVLKNSEDGQEYSSYNAKGITGPYLSLATAENTRRNAMGSSPSPMRINSMYTTPVRSHHTNAKLSGSPVMLTSLRAPKPKNSSSRNHMLSLRSPGSVPDRSLFVHSHPSVHLSAAKVAVEQYYGEDVLHKRKPVPKQRPKSVAQIKAEELLKKAKSRPPVRLETVFNPNTENYNELKRSSSFEGRRHDKKDDTIHKRLTLRDLPDDYAQAGDSQFVSSSNFKSRIPDSDDDDDDFNEDSVYSPKVKSHHPPQQPQLMLSQIDVPQKKHHRHFKLFGHHHHHDSYEGSMIKDDYARHDSKKKKRFRKFKKFFSTSG